MSDLDDFLLARIAEDEDAAQAAIDSERPGSHWHWVMDGNDTPVRRGHLQGAQDDGETVSLRTVEEYPTRSGVGPLPHSVIQFGEVHGGGGEHIARWDPARVLAECEAKRQIVAEHPEVTVWSTGESYSGDRIDEPEWFCGRCVDTSARQPWTDVDRVEYPCPTLRLLALPYADHPDYRQEWAP